MKTSGLIPLRQRRLSRRSKMTREQIMAAWTVYQQGNLTIEEIAEQIYERFGYSSVRSCRAALSARWRSYGKIPRLAIETQANRMGCKRCGCHYDDRTPGCRSCTTRHNRRGQRDMPNIRYRNNMVSRSDECVECGGELEAQSYGCKTCSDRHSKRRARVEGKTA